MFGLKWIHVSKSVPRKYDIDDKCLACAYPIQQNEYAPNSVEVSRYLLYSSFNFNNVRITEMWCNYVDRFRYIQQFTTDRWSIPMDTTAVLGIHKFSLEATIDHHRPSMYSGRFTTSINCCKKTFLMRQQQNYRVWNDWLQNLLYCLNGNVLIDYVMFLD